MSLFFILLFRSPLLVTSIVAGVAVLFLIIELILYVDRTNRLLNDFLQSIRYSDFSRTFQVESSNSSLDKLKTTFNEVIKDFQAVRAEKEENNYYLQTVVQHIGIALIAYQKDGKVELINDATKKMFQIRTLKNILALKESYPELVQKLLTIKHGENVLLKIREKDDMLQLSIYGTEFKIQNRNILLVSIKNIQQELDEKEMESWQKLIRVLTHEIMNSITPISSLSSTVRLIMDDVIETLSEREIEGDEIESLNEIKEALTTIHNRTEGLIHFVNTYRNLTKIPTPNFSVFPVKKLLQNVQHLHQNELQTLGIKCTISVEPASLELSADEQLIEQVLINLLKNSIHALQEKSDNPVIELHAYLDKRGRITIQTIDNGQGILPEVLDKIFIPFFTTKPQGSGIGLSLARQILRLHEGSINAHSEPGKETRFTLTF